MISEPYLRAVLLGGMQPTTLLSGSWTFPAISISEEPLGILSLPELERLQQMALVTRTKESELAQEIWDPHHHHVLSRSRRTPGNVVEFPINDVLTRATQGAQWDSLRTNILSRLENLYVFRDEARVRLFLERNAFLAPLLLQANRKIRDYFRTSLPITLDVSVDPEDRKYQELWARIHTHLPPADALAVLTRFDEEWWLQASVASKNLLNIKLEYV